MTNEKDAKAIHDLFSEYHYADDLGVLKSKLVEYVTRLRADGAAPVVDNLQRRLYEECVTANWDPEQKNTLAEEIAHLHEELSEAFRAWRRYKDCQIREVNGKLEGVPIEFADVLIGMFYNAELYGFDLLAAIELKHQFNLSRNYIADGRQLHAPAAAPLAATQEVQHRRDCGVPDCFICYGGTK